MDGPIELGVGLGVTRSSVRSSGRESNAGGFWRGMVTTADRDRAEGAIPGLPLTGFTGSMNYGSESDSAFDGDKVPGDGGGRDV